MVPPGRATLIPAQGMQIGMKACSSQVMMMFGSEKMGWVEQQPAVAGRVWLSS